MPEALRWTEMTAAQLRGLAHPLRWELLAVLYAEGPATASQLARRLGQSSGATSYHLRALHRAGMVEEAEQRNGRERWWQRTPERMAIPNSVPPDASPKERTELQAAHAQMESLIVEADERALARWMSIRYELPLRWQEVQWIGNLRMWATPDELEQFVASVIELAKPLRRAPENPGSERREVNLTFRALPQQSET